MKKMIAFIISAFITLTALSSFSAGAVSTDSGAVSVNDQSVSVTNLAVYAERVAYLINKERSARGLNELAMFQQLDNLADIRSGEIVSYFDHHRPDGSPFYTVLLEAGFTNFGAGENIAFGQKDPEEVVEAWMNSEGHRKNIMNSEYKYIGVGVRYANNMYYWEQIFLDVDTVYPDAFIPTYSGEPIKDNNNNNADSIVNGSASGDVNGDGYVDAVDASCVLAEYANISVGKPTTFTASQRSLADMNNDGLIDAVDASIILGIYAKNSTL